jgi:hypothetical protein
MYIVLTKNSNNTWEGISDVRPGDDTPTKTALETAIQTGLPIVGMDVTAHKETASKGATWDGSSFSEGLVADTVVDDEFWTLNKRYAFLCNNKVVLAMTVPNNANKSEMWSAAMAGETILVKNENGSYNNVGKTFTWDGTELTLVVPE